MRQLLEQPALLAEALVRPRLDEIGVPHRRAEDHDSSLSRWLVPAPHILPQLRDPRWRRAALRSEDARLAEVGCDAALILYGVGSCVESLPHTSGRRHNVEIIQEGKQRIVCMGARRMPHGPALRAAPMQTVRGQEHRPARSPRLAGFP